MKKTLSVALAFVCCVGILSACGGKTDGVSLGNSNPLECSHKFSQEWSSNQSAHWRDCIYDCGEITDYGKHTGATCSSKASCGVCGTTYGSIGEHVYGNLTDSEKGKVYFCDCGDAVYLSELVDFMVEIKETRNPVILQLTDPQIMYYKPDAAEKQCYQYIRETVEATNPDLILVTGDLIYGKFDTEDGKVFTAYVEFMESFEIPWAPIFGNHDNEAMMGVDWQCEQLENAEYCLFEQNTLTGNGNYTVGVSVNGKFLRSFYMMDSNGCSAASTASINGQNGIQSSNGLANNQISWYTESMKKLTRVSPETKKSLAFHIQTSSFSLAYTQYDEFVSTMHGNAYRFPLHFDEMETAKEGDIGFLGRPLKGAWGSEAIHNEWKKLGVDSVFVGHEHCNSASVVYNGIRYQYGQKSSTYDRYNCLTKDGKIVGGYESEHAADSAPLIGGTAFTLSKEDGKIINPYIYYCGNPFGKN